MLVTYKKGNVLRTCYNALKASSVGSLQNTTRGDYMFKQLLLVQLLWCFTAREGFPTFSTFGHI